jgi:hypothetical protein
MDVCFQIGGTTRHCITATQRAVHVNDAIFSVDHAAGGVATPELIWDRSMAETASVCLSQLASACFQHHQRQQQQHQGGGLAVWMPPAGVLVRYARLDGEVAVGGVYCRRVNYTAGSLSILNSLFGGMVSAVGLWLCLHLALVVL